MRTSAVKGKKGENGKPEEEKTESRKSGELKAEKAKKRRQKNRGIKEMGIKEQKNRKSEAQRSRIPKKEGCCMNEMMYIYEVYRQKSFSRAAKKLFISQPALSNIVKRVERGLGARIFDRSTIPLTVTREGDYYIRSIETILQVERNIDAFFDDIGKLNCGSLSIGASVYFCSFVLPEMIARFHWKHPKVHIDLYEGNVRELNRCLCEEQVDLVIETSDYAGECSIRRFPYKTEYNILAVPSECHLNKRLREYRLYEEEIISGSFLKCEKKGVPLNVFKDAPFIGMRPGNDMHRRAAEICRNAGFELKPVMEVDQIMTGINIAASGVGNFIVRADIVKHYPIRDRLTYYKIDDPLAARAVSFLAKKDRYLTAAMRGFLNNNGISTDVEESGDTEQNAWQL